MYTNLPFIINFTNILYLHFDVCMVSVSDLKIGARKYLYVDSLFRFLFILLHFRTSCVLHHFPLFLHSSCGRCLSFFINISKPPKLMDMNSSYTLAFFLSCMLNTSTFPCVVLLEIHNTDNFNLCYSTCSIPQHLFPVSDLASIYKLALKPTFGPTYYPKL